MANTSRRGFLGFLAAAGIATIAGPAIQAAPAPLPSADGYETITFTRKPGFFDLVCYTGIGSSITLPNSLGDSIGCVIIKCRTKPSDWFVLETNEANVTLPERFNERGHSYIAYQFGKEAMPQIRPYIDKLKEKNT